MARDPDRNRADRTLVGDRLWRARSAKGLEQTPLATQLGLLQPDISEWETGQRLPPLHMLWRLALALDTPVSALLGEPAPGFEQALYEASVERRLPAKDSPAKRYARWQSTGKL